MFRKLLPGCLLLKMVRKSCSDVKVKERNRKWYLENFRESRGQGSEANPNRKTLGHDIPTSQGVKNYVTRDRPQHGQDCEAVLSLRNPQFQEGRDRERDIGEEKSSLEASYGEV